MWCDFGHSIVNSTKEWEIILPLFEKLLFNSTKKSLTLLIKEWSSSAYLLCFTFILLIKVNKNNHQHLSELPSLITCNHSGWGYKSLANISESILGESTCHMEFRIKSYRIFYYLYIVCYTMFSSVKFIINICICTHMYIFLWRSCFPFSRTLLFKAMWLYLP